MVVVVLSRSTRREKNHTWLDEPISSELPIRAVSSQKKFCDFLSACTYMCKSVNFPQAKQQSWGEESAIGFVLFVYR